MKIDLTGNEERNIEWETNSLLDVRRINAYSMMLLEEDRRLLEAINWDIINENRFDR